MCVCVCCVVCVCVRAQGIMRRALQGLCIDLDTFQAREPGEVRASVRASERER